MKKKLSIFVIVKNHWSSEYKWVLKASNGHKLAQSYVLYKSRHAARVGIAAAKRAMQTAGVIEE